MILFIFMIFKHKIAPIRDSKIMADIFLGIYLVFRTRDYDNYFSFYRLLLEIITNFPKRASFIFFE